MDVTLPWQQLDEAANELPFPYIMRDEFLPADLFDRLAATFPDCPPGSGPTGFTIHPGDPAFDELVAKEADWASLARACDSEAFIRFALMPFQKCLAEEAVVDLSQARHVYYRESRADKERDFLKKPVHQLDHLWIRFDLMQGRLGYQRVKHLDHRRRAVTMLLYFAPTGDAAMSGGELVLHGTCGDVVITPRANRMVMFVCNGASWHSVTPVVAQDRPRNCLQVTVSSSVDLWPSERPKRAGMRKLLSLARR